ncbi:hypothetical protein LTS15_002660 [Exophiala xenobiotica]|nr:hypothetical protein LTS15_002660 [Exophiala xenobiotica]
MAHLQPSRLQYRVFSTLPTVEERNLQALATHCQELIDKHQYNLTVAFVSGDNMVGEVKKTLKERGTLPTTFQDINNNSHRDVTFTADAVLACNAYIGARGIVQGLENGAHLILSGLIAFAIENMDEWQAWFVV